MGGHLPSLEPPGKVGVLEVGLPPGHLVPWAMTINLFQNAKILEKNRAVPPRWISPYIKPGSKIFLSWNKCRGLNFALKVGPFCVVSLVTLQNRSFKYHTDYSCFWNNLLQKHIENHRKITLNEKFNPLLASPKKSCLHKKIRARLPHYFWAPY